MSDNHPTTEKDAIELFRARITTEDTMDALKEAIVENKYIKDAELKKKELGDLYDEVGNEDDTEVLKQIAAMLLTIKVDLSGNDADFGDVLKELLFAPGPGQPQIKEEVLCPGENYIRCRRIEPSDGVYRGPAGTGPQVAAVGGKRKTRKHKKKGKKKTMKKKGKKKTIKRKKGKKKSKKRGKKKTVKRKSKKSRK